MARLGRYNEDRVVFMTGWGGHRHRGTVEDGSPIATASIPASIVLASALGDGAVTRRKMANATIINTARIDDGAVTRRALNNATIVNGPRIDSTAITARMMATGTWRGRRIATVKHMLQVQYAKATGYGVAATINVGGATSGITRVWGLIPFAQNATCLGGAAAGNQGLSSVAYTWLGQTVVIPANVATLGALCNMLIWGA